MLDNGFPGDGTTGDQPDLNLAESAPMTLDADVFDGLLDYALSADAHDVDDSIVPDDLDSIGLADDSADPLDDATPDPSTADPADDGIDDLITDDALYGSPENSLDDTTGDSLDASVPDPFAGGTADDGGADTSPSDSDLDW
ncbi:hypothetical protein ACFWGD_12620 [Corynebacterium sp. NPDC060344]|uniref:hypothetical protein n=1 Tax=Corynebacterium sp. NPDC060344 TaxID=3347101 RepID=UPI0036656916